MLKQDKLECFSLETFAALVPPHIIDAKAK